MLMVSLPAEAVADNLTEAVMQYLQSPWWVFLQERVQSYFECMLSFGDQWQPVAVSSSASRCVLNS